MSFLVASGLSSGLIVTARNSWHGVSHITCKFIWRLLGSFDKKEPHRGVGMIQAGVRYVDRFGTRSDLQSGIDAFFERVILAVRIPNGRKLITHRIFLGGTSGLLALLPHGGT